MNSKKEFYTFEKLVFKEYNRNKDNQFLIEYLIIKNLFKNGEI